MNALDATAGARLIIDALVAGLRHPDDAGADAADGAAGFVDVVMAPGSRSTPLVAACARDPRIRLSIVHDERSGAFVALGLARGSGRAAVLLMTSGTAVANAGPAVVEADRDNVPLVVLSADRPWEAADTDANQSIEQRFFFGARVRAFVDVPPPEDVRDPLALQMALDEVSALAHRSPRGPVHINARFRKPLEPSAALPLPPTAMPRLRRCAFVMSLSAASIELLLLTLHQAKSGVIVAGAAADDDDSVGFAALARALGWPLLCCATSGLRDPSWALPVVGTASLLMKAKQALPTADVVLRLGGALVDDGLAEVCAAATQVVRIDERQRRRLERSAPTLLFEARPVDVAAVVAAAVAAGRSCGGSGPWLDVVAADQQARAALQADRQPTCDEPAIARLVVQAALAGGTALFVGNSMPIRNVDRFCPQAPRVLANRGASGIDGLLSTAAGIALARGPTLALMGDLSLLHDAGALSALATWAPLPLRVVVVDNGGGGIFDFLPIARHPELLTRCFSTPHQVDLVALARAYRVPAVALSDLDAVRDRLRRPIEGLEIVVVHVERSLSVSREAERIARVALALAARGT